MRPQNRDNIQNYMCIYQLDVRMLERVEEMAGSHRREQRKKERGGEDAWEEIREEEKSRKWRKREGEVMRGRR